MDTNTLLIIFVGLTGVAVIMQACVLFAIFVSLKRTAESVKQATDDLKATVLPMAHSTRELIERITPQVIAISSGLAELTELVHKESKGVRVSVSEITERVSRQTARLDGMLTHGLNAVERTGSLIESTLAKPIRQANGIAAAAKAVVDTYIHFKPKPRLSRVDQHPHVMPAPDLEIYPRETGSGSGI